MDLTIQDIFNLINEGLHIFQKLCMKYFSCVELKLVEVYIYNFKLFDFPIFLFWAYLMNVIPKRRRAH